MIRAYRKGFLKFFTVLLSVMLIASCAIVEPTYAASKPAKVSGLKMTARSASTISISWKKAKRAKKYEISYSNGDGTWKSIKQTKRTKKLTGLKEYTRYSIKVRGLRGSKKGTWSSTINVYTEPKTFEWPELPLISGLEMLHSGPGSVTLGWSIAYPEPVTEELEPEEEIEEQPEETAQAVTPEETSEEVNEEVQEQPEQELQAEPVEETQEAVLAEAEPEEEQTVVVPKCTDYILKVYRSTNNTDWTLVSDELPAGTESFICRKCDAGTNYYFKVVAVDKTSYTSFTHTGEYSDVLSATSSGIPGLKIHKNYTTRNLIYKEKRTYDCGGLMVHSVGAAVGTATKWVDTYNAKGYDRAAVHAFVDGYTGTVEWTMPWTQRAGHAGKSANDKYVGVEMCESKHIKYTSGTKFKVLDKEKAVKSATLTYETTVKLFAYLCDYFGFDPSGKDVILSHNEWRLKGNAGHYDPEHYWNGLGLSYTMKGFRKDVANALAIYR